MAQRFGGKYSPPPGRTDRADPPLAGREIPAELAVAPLRHPHEGRPFWVVLCATPFLLGAFGDGPVSLALSLGAFAGIALSSFLTREGLRAQVQYEARRVARRPALPRKALGALILALSLGAGAWLTSGPVGAAILGLVGGFVHMLTFGPDPMKDKGMEGIDPYQQDRVARAIEEGEKHLAAMKDAIARARDRQLEARVALFAASARNLFEAVESDPSDLTAARRYMGVYLMGARDATVKFVDLWTATRDSKARTDYEALLSDLERNFNARTRSLIENGREGLDVEIDVLRERLAREGVRLQNGG
jgi:hypothetical protein